MTAASWPWSTTRSARASWVPSRTGSPTGSSTSASPSRTWSGVGAGLANGGKMPFVSAAACFLTARAMEQIKVDAAYSQHHIVLVGQSPGMAYGELGPTHHSIEDLAWLRTIPGLTVIVPTRPRRDGPGDPLGGRSRHARVRRVSRMGVPDVMPEGTGSSLAGPSSCRSGHDVTIVATGTTVSRALDAAASLGGGRRLGARARDAHHQAPRRRGAARCRTGDSRHRHRRGGPDVRAGRRRRGVPRDSAPDPHALRRASPTPSLPPDRSSG